MYVLNLLTDFSNIYYFSQLGLLCMNVDATNELLYK